MSRFIFYLKVFRLKLSSLFARKFKFKFDRNIVGMSRFIFYLKVFRRKSSSRFALTRPSPSKLGPFRVWLLTRPLLSKLGPFCVWLLTRPWLSKLGLFRVWLQVFRRKFSSRFARKFKFKFDRKSFPNVTLCMLLEGILTNIFFALRTNV